MGEEMLSKVVKDVKGIDIQTPFPRMTYDALNTLKSISFPNWDTSCNSIPKRVSGLSEPYRFIASSYVR
jgi:hypothetical protein